MAGRGDCAGDTPHSWEDPAAHALRFYRQPGSRSLSGHALPFRCPVICNRGAPDTPGTASSLSAHLTSFCHDLSLKASLQIQVLTGAGV